MWKRKDLQVRMQSFGTKETRDIRGEKRKGMLGNLGGNPALDSDLQHLESEQMDGISH